MAGTSLSIAATNGTFGGQCLLNTTPFTVPSGTTVASYMLPATTAAGSYTVSCVDSTAAANRANATITVTQGSSLPFLIALSPNVVAPGASVTITATNGKFGGQCLFNGAAFTVPAGATTANYTVPAATPVGSYSLRCTNSTSTTTSTATFASALLTVGQSLQVFDLVTSMTSAAAGQSFSLSAPGVTIVACNSNHPGVQFLSGGTGIANFKVAATAAGGRATLTCSAADGRNSNPRQLDIVASTGFSLSPVSMILRPGDSAVFAVPPGAGTIGKCQAVPSTGTQTLPALKIEVRPDALSVMIGVPSDAQGGTSLTVACTPATSSGSTTTEARVTLKIESGSSGTASLPNLRIGLITPTAAEFFVHTNTTTADIPASWVAFPVAEGSTPTSPTAANILAHQDGTGRPAFLFGSITLPRNGAEVLIKLPGLTGNTAYRVALLGQFSASSFDIRQIDLNTPAVGSVSLPPTVVDPLAFSFAPIVGVPPGELAMSAPITVRGITTLATITVQGGEYSISGGAWTSAEGKVGIASTVRVRGYAPSTFDSSKQVILTIGGVSSTLSISTRRITTVSSPGNVFADPQTASLQSDGTLRIGTAPTAPMRFADGAPSDALVRIPVGITVPVTYGGKTLNYEPQSGDASLQLRPVDGASGLRITSGRVNITAPELGSTIPLTADDSGNSAKLSTSEAATKVATIRDSDRNIVLAVDTGKVRFTGTLGTPGNAANFDVYAGETLVTDESGTASKLRLGSAEQNEDKAGDFISGIQNAASDLKVPRLSGSAPRFGDLQQVAARALASHLGLSTSGVSLVQDSQTGVLTLTAADGTSYRYLPIGNVSIDVSSVASATKGMGASRAVSASGIASNLLSIVSDSLEFSVAPAASYSDFETAIKQVSTAATMEILADGAVKATLNGNQYIATPAAQLIPGGAECPKLDQVGANLAICDAQGYRQILYPAFSDTDFVVETFTSELTPATVTVSNTGLGDYIGKIDTATIKLSPDILLSTPSATQAGKLWWQDTETRFYIRYSDDAAQGFSIQ